MAEKKASVHWEGRGKAGQGQISTETGALKAYPYGFASRFEDDRRGTNPEEILGAAHAACFTMAFSFACDKAGFTTDSVDTKAAVRLVAKGDGFVIDRIALEMEASVPGIDEAKFQEIAQARQGRLPAFQGSCQRPRDHPQRQAAALIPRGDPSLRPASRRAALPRGVHTRGTRPPSRSALRGLRAPTMPGYATKQESIPVAGVADLLIRSLLDRQQYADPAGRGRAPRHLVGGLADVRAGLALGGRNWRRGWPGAKSAAASASSNSAAGSPWPASSPIAAAPMSPRATATRSRRCSSSAMPSSTACGR